MFAENWRSISVVLGGLLMCRCDCGGGNEIAKVEPKLQIEPLEVAFGQVPLGATKIARVLLNNAGSAELSLSEVRVEAPFAASLPVIKLNPGLSVGLDVSFSPTTSEPVSSDLIITSDDPATPTATIRLSGQGVASQIAVFPRALDLRSTTVGSRQSREITISNLGIEPMSIRIVTERFDRPEHFSLSSVTNFSEPSTYGIPPLARAVLDFEYRPLAIGEDRGVIRFEYCGEGCGADVQVDASGVESSLRLTPPAIQFGAFAIGEKRTQQLLIQNAGGVPLQLASVEAVGGSEIVASPSSSLPTNVPPQGTFAVLVEFTPANSVPFKGRVIVRSNDPVLPEASVEVTGVGQGPQFAVVPETIDFGIERSSGTYRRNALLMNLGSQEVFVEHVEVQGDSAFDLEGLPGLPARLGAGESIIASVRFRPTDIREYAGSLLIRSTDPAKREVNVPIRAGLTDQLCELDSSPPLLNFGLLPPSFVRVLSETLTNIGTDVCTLESGAFRAPVDPAFTLISTPFPVAVAPGASVKLDFQYAPAAMVDSKANFVIMTDDPVFPERQVSLIASSKGYVDIFARPETIDFGAVGLGCSPRRREVRVYNGGNLSATIDRVTFASGAGPANEIRLSNPLTVPAALLAGSFVAFSLEYQPADLGEDQSEIEVAVKDLPYPIVVPSRGEGSMSPRVTNTFEQGKNEALDVLFVVDDSCSMADDQRALAANFAQFISQASVRDVDFRLGVTTTTLEPVPGSLRGPVLTPRTADLEEEFRSQVAVGVQGSGFERGLDAMLSALELAKAGAVPNSGLLRPGAGLVVIIVSDEDDQSAATPVFYYNYLRNAVGSQLLTAMVTGETSGCLRANGGSADPALRYAEFTRISNGISESICANWSTTLRNIGAAAFALRQSFDLAEEPDRANPIEVRVDGVLVPQADWRYDATSNRITFSQPPPEGAKISVEFTPKC